MVEERTGKAMEGVRSPELPLELVYLWEAYFDVKKGCDCIEWLDLDHYQNVTGSILSPWEASLMIDIDMVRRRHG